MKIAILGYGVEGKSAQKFLKEKFPDAKIEIRDIKRQGKDYLKGLENFDLIIRSPGIKYLSLEIQRAEKLGVEVSSATKLFMRNLLSLRRRGGLGGKVITIGITGTKGKGTTATMLYQILKSDGRRSGKKVFLAGNIGKPMLYILPKLKKNSIVILELSSFQLQDLDTPPDIAVILDIAPDHLNYHKNFKKYLDAKAKIIKPLSRHKIFQGHAYSPVFFFPDNKFSKQIAEKSCGEKFPISLNSTLILKAPGRHNLKNASMAAAVAKNLGVSKSIIEKALRNFKGLPQHLEFVKKIHGVDFYNDSASTNPASTIAAIKSFSRPIILIAGGTNKGFNYSFLGKEIGKSKVKSVFLYGANKNEIKKYIPKKIPVF